VDHIAPVTLKMEAADLTISLHGVKTQKPRYEDEIMVTFSVNNFHFREFLGFHGGDVSSRDLLGCDSAYCCGRIPKFQGSMLSSSSGL
jgi:hypothetical protein